MFDFSQATINDIIVHKIGNKGREEENFFSKSSLKIADDFLQTTLSSFFLSPFKDNRFFNFEHTTSEEGLFENVSKVFNNPSCFIEESLIIANTLYNHSVHPQIKTGEFYLVYFKDCVVEDELCDALGLFKSENKDRYLKVFNRNENLELNCEDGININRLDKGCLIFNTEKDLGFKISIVDNLNKGSEAQYWKDDFLRLKQREDSFYHTSNAVNLCRSFVADVVTEKNSYSKKEQMEVKAKAAEYFNKKEAFNSQEFTEEVIRHPELIEAFEDYKESYVKEKNIAPILSEFELSEVATKGAKKDFKSVIKLDKSFTFYVHGSPNLMERGYDDGKNMNYYKLFFKEEK